MSVSQCVGWWQQVGLGRQAMDNLLLSISGDRITGSGTDIVAPFTLAGQIRGDGVVELIKQYEHRHAVLYIGTFDGEGTLSGVWDIDGFQGEWWIRFLRPLSPLAMEIREIEPVK